MADADQSTYYVPHASAYPIWTAIGMFFLVVGLGAWLNDLRSGDEPSYFLFGVGAVLLTLADVAVRLLPLPSGRLPIGVVTALAGGPALLVLMRKGAS